MSITMDYMPGKRLDEAWDTLNSDQKLSIKEDTSVSWVDRSTLDFPNQPKCPVPLGNSKNKAVGDTWCNREVQ